MRAAAANISTEGPAQRLVRDVHSQLTTALKGASLWDSLDYFEISMGMQKRENAPFPSFQWLACAPVTRGEHHYVYIGTVLNGRYNLIFVGKTSQGFEHACQVANRCATELGA
jgi:hypothetical protein